MIDVEVFGVPASRGGVTSDARDGADLPSLSEISNLCTLAAASAGVHDGHVAVEFVDERRITELNAEHRSLSEPTDVLSFPIDGAEPSPGGRELGDVVICLARTADVREAVVHGVLHLLGMDHETDDGQMLERQRELLARERP
ncbi:MAG: rRNA maturation RNase YbeY [Solirubrobacteraceae bacterium]